MALTISTVPLYAAAGEPVRLVGTSDDNTDDATMWELTSVPDASRLALGQIVERHPTVARAVLQRMTFRSANTATGRAATIVRPEGSFVTDGFAVGQSLTITGTTSNNITVTVAAVAGDTITLADGETLTDETALASLTGGTFGSNGAATDAIVFDVPGDYGITGHEYLAIPALGGAYDSDPLSVAQRRYIGPASATIHVGGYVEIDIAPVNGHGATLRLLVVDSDDGRGMVRAAELVNPATELARQATLDATVAAAVQAMVGLEVNEIDVDFVTDVNNLASAFAAHILLTTGSVHASADSTNALLTEPANSVPAAIARLNDLAARIAGHQRAGTSGGTWHAADDGKNTLQVPPSATSLAQAVVLKADLRERVYERHRAQTASPASHGAADNTNAMTAPKKLPSAIEAFLDFVAGGSASIPSGEAEGVGDAQAAWGFRFRG